MKEIRQRDSYPAKLLLFGEYSVLNGSQALAVPLRKFSGSWQNKETGIAGEELPVFFRWLYEEKVASEEAFEKMHNDWKDGWRYISDIPFGYGVGSSGAYVAAIYDRYIQDSSPDFTAVLSKMESCFHGKSSGMDPLVSYTEKAVYKNEQGKFSFLEDPGWPKPFQLYLLDSGNSRETEDLVKIFREKFVSSDFSQRIQRELVPFVEHAIHFYLQGESQQLKDCLYLISLFQREYFTDMIPVHVSHSWDQLMMLPGVIIKLCGAGGGGYFMVLSTDASSDEKLQLYPNLIRV